MVKSEKRIVGSGSGKWKVESAQWTVKREE